MSGRSSSPSHKRSKSDQELENERNTPFRSSSLLDLTTFGKRSSVSPQIPKKLLKEKQQFMTLQRRKTQGTYSKSDLRNVRKTRSFDFIGTIEMTKIDPQQFQSSLQQELSLKITSDGTVRGARYDQLIEYLIAGNSDQAVLLNFFAAFPQIIDTGMVWKVAEYMYCVSNPPSNHQEIILRRRSLEFIYKWIENCFERDFLNRPLYNRLLNFLQRLDAKDGNKFKLLILRIKSNSKKIVSQNIVPKKKRAASTLSSSLFEFYEIDDTDEVADQLTFSDFELFKNIKENEFYKCVWKDENHKEELAPNITRMVDRFNNVSFWVATEIVLPPNVKDRVQMLKRFISIAERFRETNNFNGLMQIIGGINCWAVQRLKNTWDLLPRQCFNSFEELSSLMDNKQNYKAYRAALASAKGPVLPYLGIFLRDLTFVEEANENMIGDSKEGILNFEKIQLIGSIINDIKKYQSIHFGVTPNPKLQQNLQNVQALPEELLYKYSLSREPSKTFEQDKKRETLMKLLEKGSKGELIDNLEKQILKSILFSCSEKEIKSCQEQVHRHTSRNPLLPNGLFTRSAFRLSKYSFSFSIKRDQINEPQSQVLMIYNNGNSKCSFSFQQHSYSTNKIFFAFYPSTGEIERGKFLSIEVKCVAFTEVKLEEVFSMQLKYVGVSYENELQEINENFYIPVSVEAQQPSPVQSKKIWEIDVNELDILKSIGTEDSCQLLLCNLWDVKVVAHKWEYGRLEKPPETFTRCLESLVDSRQPRIVTIRGQNLHQNFLGAVTKSIGKAFIICEWDEGQQEKLQLENSKQENLEELQKQIRKLSKALSRSGKENEFLRNEVEKLKQTNLLLKQENEKLSKEMQLSKTSPPDNPSLTQKLKDQGGKIQMLAKEVEQKFLAFIPKLASLTELKEVESIFSHLENDSKKLEELVNQLPNGKKELSFHIQSHLIKESLEISPLQSSFTKDEKQQLEKMISLMQGFLQNSLHILHYVSDKFLESKSKGEMMLIARTLLQINNEYRESG